MSIRANTFGYLSFTAVNVGNGGTLFYQVSHRVWSAKDKLDYSNMEI